LPKNSRTTSSSSPARSKPQTNTPRFCCERRTGLKTTFSRN